MIEVKAKQLRAFLALSADADVRYCLHGIYVDCSQRVLVATNGHVMGVWRPDGDGSTFLARDMLSRIIPRAAIQSALKLAGASGSVRIHADNKLGAVDRKGAFCGTVDYVPVDGRFPDWQRVVPGSSGAPRSQDTAMPQFNAEYLATCQKFLTSLADTGKPFQFVKSFGGDTAAIVTRESVDFAFCVCMPLGKTEPNAAAVINLMAKCETPDNVRKIA